MAMDTYTFEEVAKHNGNSDNGVWIVVKNIVYDVTEYINEHPGGGELILEYAGKDATTGFNDFGHSSDALKLLKLYKIGHIAKVDNNKQKTQQGDKAENNDDVKRKTSKRKTRKFLFPLFRNCAS